jgi:hypothetical protein
MAEIKDLWEKFRQMQDNEEEKKRREFLNAHKGHCHPDYEKVNKYHEHKLINHEQ